MNSKDFKNFTINDYNNPTKNQDKESGQIIIQRSEEGILEEIEIRFLEQNKLIIIDTENITFSCHEFSTETLMELFDILKFELQELKEIKSTLFYIN